MTTYELIEFFQKARDNKNKTINLSNKGIIEIPAEVCLLEGISSLDLSNNNITKLPPEIGELIKLKELNLKRNEIHELPDEFSNLVSLERLHLNDNEFRVFPDVLYSMKTIRHICIGGNNIPRVDDSISNLNQLVDIVLSNNRIKEFPLGLTKIRGLKTISIEGNFLRELPIEITEMNNLAKLLVSRNPHNIPPEVMSRGTRYLFSYIRKHDEATNKKFFSEAKLIFVGDGNVGKTSLVRMLQGFRFDRHQDKTEGIAIKKWGLKLDSEREVSVNIWDFGGQEIMHATHQFFLTQRSVYVLVLNTREEDRYGMVEYWLKLIKSFGSDSPIIIALNKSDEHIGDVDRKGLINKYNVHGFVATSCKASKGKNELIELIKSAVNSLDHTKIEWLDNEFKVKRKLEGMQYDFISYNMYEDICKEEGVTDDKNLIKFLHDLGIVLNFHDDERLNDTNILNPSWVTNGVYKILNSRSLSDNKGVLEINSVSKILTGKEYPKEKHLFIIDMMKRFELCFDLDGTNGSKLLVPELLPLQEPDFLWNYTNNLVFQYKYDFIASSIMSRFIVKVHNFIDSGIYWKNGVIIRKDGNRCLVKADKEERSITIYVDGNENTKRDALSQVRFQFDSIHASINNIFLIEYIPVPGTITEFVKYRYLLQLEKNEQTHYITEGGNKIKIANLLNGINTEADKRMMFNEESQSQMSNTNTNNFNPNINITNNVGASPPQNDASQKKEEKPWYKKVWIWLSGIIAFAGTSIALINNSWNLSDKVNKPDVSTVDKANSFVKDHDDSVKAVGIKKRNRL